MTTVAYKNGILAADKQTNFGNLPGVTTKVRRIGAWLTAGAGTTARIYELHQWIEGGMDAERFPRWQRDTETSVQMMLVDEKGEIHLLETSPALVHIEQPFFSIGSGRDFAMMAMHLGKSAPEAVDLAAIYDIATGQGVDTLALAQPLAAWSMNRRDSMLRAQRQLRQGEPGFLVPKL